MCSERCEPLWEEGATEEGFPCLPPPPRVEGHVGQGHVGQGAALERPFWLPWGRVDQKWRVVVRPVRKLLGNPEEG